MMVGSTLSDRCCRIVQARPRRGVSKRRYGINRRTQLKGANHADDLALSRVETEPLA